MRDDQIDNEKRQRQRNRERERERERECERACPVMPLRLIYATRKDKREDGLSGLSSLKTLDHLELPRRQDPGRRSTRS